MTTAELNFARLTEADHRKAYGREIAERREGVDAALKVLEFGHGEIHIIIAGAEGALLDINEAAFICVDERAKKNAAYEAEDGGIGTDPES